MIEPKISIVTLGVADVPRARAFYEALGWEAASTGGDEISWMRTAGSWLGLFGRADLAQDAGMPNAGMPDAGLADTAVSFGGITLAINVGAPADVDAALADALAAGGTISQPAASVDFGGYRGYFLDLDGHPWEVCWNPGFPLAADGTIEIP